MIRSENINPRIFGDRGFSLLELLIGTTIFVLAVTSVYASLFLGIKVWKQEESREDFLLEAELAEEIMAEHLRCAFWNSEDDTVSFQGAAKEINFFTVTSEGSVKEVRLYCQNSLEEPERIFLYRQLSLPGEEKSESFPAVIHSRLGVCGFEFWDQDSKTWLTEWREESRMPAAVRIRLGPYLSSLEGEAKVLDRIVFIPVGRGVRYE